MIVPLAVSGPIVIGVVVLAALVLLYVLLRGEADYEGHEDGEQEPDADGGAAAGGTQPHDPRG